MKRARLTVSTIVAGAIVIGLTACGGSSSGSGAATGSNGTTTTTASSSDVQTASSPSTQSSTAPTTNSTAPAASTGKAAGSVLIRDREHLLYVLEAVDPGIGTDESHLIAQTEAMCAHISAGADDAALQAEATKSFANGSFVPSDLEAQAIVGTVRAYAC